MGRRAKKTNRHFAAIVSTVLAATALITGLPEEEDRDAALAAETNKVSLYLSAPFVQGSHVKGTANSTSENFNELTAGSTCPTSTLVGTISFANGNCGIYNPSEYSGAASESVSPAYGGPGTVSVGVPYYDSGSESERSLTIDFGGPVKYVGLWWSAGNNGNIVRFLDASNRLVAELSSNDIVSVLGPAERPYGTSTVPTFGGGTQVRSKYYGNPRFATEGQLTTSTTYEDYQSIFTYLNLFLNGDLGVTKMQVAGPGFEFDNVVVSTVQQDVRGSMVLITEKSVPTITWAPTTNLWVGDSPATPSSLATSSVAGSMSYSVVNQGATGCTVNSSTGVISYTAIGDCVVRASFTPTNSATSFPATKDVTFTIARAAQTITWAPTTALLLDASPATPSTAATTSGNGAITYSVHDAGNTGCTVDANTGEITYTAIGDCVVRATAAQTSLYNSATKDVTFTIAAPVVEEVVVPATPYTGPVPTNLDVSCMAAGQTATATLFGERLNLISGAEVDGKKVTMLGGTSSSLKLGFPALSAGIYSVTYFSDNGRLTHQDSLRVCASSAITNPGQVTNPGQITTGTPTASASKFFVSKRFTNYRGDRGPVVAQDRRAIEAFVKANPGLKTVTCVGSTSGSRILNTDAALARARATNACKIVASMVPGVTTKTAISVGRGTGQFFRAVTIFGSGSKAN